MRLSVHWSWLAALFCLLCMGGEVQCDCTEVNMQIEGGHYKLTKELKAGSKLVYNCPEGYYPYPALTRLCHPNGTWTPAPKRFVPQRCRLVECPDPNVLENGNVFPPQERYFVGNETTYECYSGHTMRGSSRRVCLPNGKWSGSTPICSRDSGDDCADPGIPAGASRTGNTFGIKDTVKYSCSGNLFLVGSSERVCQESGYWTGKEPACYYKHTYDTPLEVSEAFGSAIKDTLTKLEPIDDTQEGRKIRISKNGTLNIYIAMDISESISEKQVIESKEAVIKLITKISSFTVTPNYEILFFACDIFEVVNILDSWDDNITLHTVKSQVESFQLGDKGTAGADLNVVFKTFLERMIMTKYRVGEEAFKEHRHVLIVFTDGAYNVGGVPALTVAKIKNMIYADHNGKEETQSREEHLDIYVFSIGSEIYDEELQPLTAGTGGQHYFRMKYIDNLQEIFDDIIDAEEFKGLCGLHMDGASADKQDRDIKRKLYPWMAFIHVQKEGASRSCLGSLVTPQFVLTAATCFPFGVLPEHITVEIDDGRGRVKKVKGFQIHPEYNIHAKVNQGVKEFYDYDVALIQLKEDVQISSAVRPICIPCTQETRDALKLVGSSTCRDQEQLLLKNHFERLTFLTRTANIVDEKDVIAKLGDTRDACIRHALGAKGITTDNPKDAVTDNFLCTGGRSPYRDHIACIGDTGGAVFKNYEHRTIQAVQLPKNLVFCPDGRGFAGRSSARFDDLMDEFRDGFSPCFERTEKVALVSWGTKIFCSAGGLVESDETSRDFHINLFRVVPFLKSVLGNDDQDDYAPLQFLES